MDYSCDIEKMKVLQLATVFCSAHARASKYWKISSSSKVQSGSIGSPYLRFIDFRLAQALRETDKKNQELLKNVPTQALRKSVVPPPAESKGDLKTSGGKKGPVGVTQVPRIVVTQSIEHLTVDEFEKVPKYMKGRLTYDSLSQAVEEFNVCLVQKYEFLFKSLNELSLKEKKRRNILKSQDKPELKGKQFLTTEELKDFSMYKTDNSRKAVITVLRHFQRIRENRGPGSIIRYVVVS